MIDMYTFEFFIFFLITVFTDSRPKKQCFLYKPAKTGSAAGKTVITALALVATTSVLRPGVLPSDRYCRLLSEGGKDYGLDSDYIDYLDAHPHHKKTLCSKCCIFLLWFLLLPLHILMTPFWCIPCLRKSKCTHMYGSMFINWLWCIHACLPSFCKGRFVTPKSQDSDGSVRTYRTPSELAKRWPNFKEPPNRVRKSEQFYKNGSSYTL